jgi:hypothetical protein
MDENNQHYGDSQGETNDQTYSDGGQTQHDNVVNTSDNESDNVPSPSDEGQTLPDKEDRHVVTVREAHRRFHNSGYPVSERTIIRWCHPNRRGTKNLDCGADPIDGKFFISDESIESHLKRVSQAVTRQAPPEKFESDVHTPQSDNDQDMSVDSHDVARQADRQHQTQDETQSDTGRESVVTSQPVGINNERVEELERELDETKVKLMDQTILAKVKEEGMKQMQRQMEEERSYSNERVSDLIEKLTDGREQIGTLKTQLLQLEAPDNTRTRDAEFSESKENPNQEGQQEEHHDNQPQNHEGEWRG